MQVLLISCWPLTSKVRLLRTGAKQSARQVASGSKSAHSSCNSAAIAAPKRSLGQNFMSDQNTLAKIVSTIGAGPDDLFIEIGPGRGALTKHLLSAASSVVAVEKDRQLCEMLDTLAAQGSSSGRLKVIEGDILTVDKQDLLRELLSLCQTTDRIASEATRLPTHARVVANLPFNITSDVLQTFLPLGDQISHLHLLLEDGAAKRLVRTGPREDVYRSINVLVNYYAKPHYHFRVPRTVFSPKPHVDAALTTFCLRPSSCRPLHPAAEDYFEVFVDAAFRAKRKRLRNVLRPAFLSSDVEQALTTLGFGLDARAVDLSAQQFVGLYLQLRSQAVGVKQDQNSDRQQ